MQPYFSLAFLSTPCGNVQSVEHALHPSPGLEWSSAGPPIYRCVSDDPNAHADNLRGWSQLYDQLSVGAFSGELSGANFGSIHIFRESTNLGLRQSCLVRSNGWWFGLPVSEEESFRIDARRLNEGAVAIRRGHRPFELITPPSFRIFGLVMNHNKLAAHLRSVLPEEDAISRLDSEKLETSPRSSSTLRSLFTEILGEISRRPEVLSSPSATQAIEGSVLDALTDLCTTAQPGREAPRSEVQHSQIVKNVRAFLLENAHRAIGVPELCSVFDVSRRTLQYAFDHVLGIGPNAYLKILRLNGVRRALCQKDAQVSVQQAASDWGFWHFSQFAKDYRNLFDELPSTTVRRAERCLR